MLTSFVTVSIGVFNGVLMIPVIPSAYSSLGVESDELVWSRFKDKPVLIMCNMDNVSGV